MSKKKMSLAKIIEEMENIPGMKGLPEELKDFIRERLEEMTMVKFPVVTMRENGYVVAHTPLIDVSSQGETEEKAVEYLKAMIDDWMTDPDTLKPKIKSIVQMEVGVRTVPMKIPLYNFGGVKLGKNTPTTQR